MMLEINLRVRILNKFEFLSTADTAAASASSVDTKPSSG